MLEEGQCPLPLVSVSVDTTNIHFVAYCFLCSNFATDSDCVRLQQLPIDPKGKDLYTKCGDGLLLWLVCMHQVVKSLTLCLCQ